MSYISSQQHLGIPLILYPQAENLSINFIYDKFSAIACSHYNASVNVAEKARTAACVLPPYKGPPLPPWAAYSLAADCTSDDPRCIFKESVEIGADRGDLYLISYTENTAKVPKPYGAEQLLFQSHVFGVNDRRLYSRHRYQLLFHRSPTDRGIQTNNWFEVIPNYHGFSCNDNDNKWTFQPPVDALDSRLRDTSYDRYTCRQVRNAIALFEHQKDHILKNATEITFLADDGGERFGIVDPSRCGIGMMKNICRPSSQSTGTFVLCLEVLCQKDPA